MARCRESQIGSALKARTRRPATIRLTRQLTLATPEPEARGLLALLLLQHARLPARTDSAGRLVTLDEQDRSLWNTAEIAEGVDILQSALAEDSHERYQILAAIAALHDDAITSADTTGAPWHAVRAYLHELGGDLAPAAEEYAAAAQAATETTERDHLVRRAARAHARLASAT